ncbi:MAG: protein kinase [Acidobacteria bacterium]|nr:protein kinase [Acidobacteriota bacterium]
MAFTMPPNTLGRYQIESELGRGAMGIVYRGYDPTIGRAVAIKTILLETSNPDSMRRLRREAQAAGILSHPNIVTVYDAGEENGLFYLAMEMVEGETLHQRLTRGPMRVEEAILIVEQVGAALDYAHSRKIIHRDIKPANIMLTEGRAKVMDFGIAKAAGAGITTTGELLGTPSYMSPELIQGKGADQRSDLFSLGAMLYEMLTGAKPFMGDNIGNVFYKILQEEPNAPSSLNPALPASLDTVILRTLAKEPAARYPNCAEFLAELKRQAALAAVEPEPSQKRAAVSAERMLAAIMFTDMVGYSALTQQNESLALKTLSAHHELLRAAFGQYGGREVKTIGDAFLVEFTSALDAARCAMEVQARLNRYNSSAPPQKRIQVRVGIHVGDVVHKGGDVFGDAVNIASRIEPLAPPGGICVSQDVERQVRNKIAAPLRRIGRHVLKNIAQPVEVYEIALPGGATAAPVRQRKPALALLTALLLILIGLVLWRQRGRTPEPVAQEFAPAVAASAGDISNPGLAPGSEETAGKQISESGTLQVPVAAPPAISTKASPPASAKPSTPPKLPTTPQPSQSKATTLRLQAAQPAPEESAKVGITETPSAPALSPVRRLLRAIPLGPGPKIEIPDQAGRVAVHTDPPGARISVDGEATSYRSPVNIPLAPGRHRITVERRGFGPETREVTVHKDEVVQMRLELRPE